MSVARRQYTPDEIKKMIALDADGWTYQQIADQIRPGVKSAWRSVGEIIRREREASLPSSTLSDPPTTTVPRASSVNSRAIGGSKVTMPDTMLNSGSAREFFSMLDDDERSLFVSHYEDLRGEADDEQLTVAENEMLIRASFVNVRYIKSQRMLGLCENYMMMDLEGELGDSDADKNKKRLAGRGDTYRKEADQWSKEYKELLDGLKLTRKQRLEKIKDNRNTFLDLQQELMTKARQSSIVEEIKRINMATREEFFRMARGEVGPDGARHPWLIGAFADAMPLTPPEPESAPPPQQEATQQLGDKDEPTQGNPEAN